MQNLKPYKLLSLLLVCFVFSNEKAKAQNVSSPYSILGIGDVDTRNYGRYFSEGGTSLARRDAPAYNTSNPAALTSLPNKVMNFDVSLSGRIASFQMPVVDTAAGTSKDFVFKRLAIAFKVSKTTAFAIGFKPYSTVNYQFASSQAVLSGNTVLTRLTDGSGGISQIYFSIGRKIGKNANSDTKDNLSIGATASYLFGSINQLTQYTVIGLPINITQQNTNSYYGASLQGGIQYYTPIASARKWKYKIGLTATAYSSLRGQYITGYVDSNNIGVTPIPQTVQDGQVFKMPYDAGLGFAATFNNSFTYSFDVNYYDWPSQTVKYNNSSTTPALRVSAGIEYSKKITYFNNPSFERYFLAFGASAQNSYILVNGNYLKEYAGSIGGGYNLSGSLSLTGGIEFGVRGDLNAQQIRENYTNVVIGLTFKNSWYGTKKFGRFL
jgi:hypothetical protein